MCVCVCVKLMSYLQTIVLCMHSRRSGHLMHLNQQFDQFCHGGAQLRIMRNKTIIGFGFHMIAIIIMAWRLWQITQTLALIIITHISNRNLNPIIVNYSCVEWKGNVACMSQNSAASILGKNLDTLASLSIVDLTLFSFCRKIARDKKRNKQKNICVHTNRCAVGSLGKRDKLP